VARVLIVDDDAEITKALARLLERDGHVSETAANVRAARRTLGRNSFELVLCDLNMPGESGMGLVREVVAREDDIAVVMVTGMDDPALADAALDLGAYGYVVKPFRTSELMIAVANALRRRRLEIENRAHREHLEQIVLERTSALRDAVAGLERTEQELRRSREETIHRLARAAEFRSEETGRHIERVGHYCALLAERLGLPLDRRELLRLASPLHDIGKIAIPDRLLLKPGPLTDQERRQMEKHAELGHQLLAGSDHELLELAAVVALTHHERPDGLGYPQGLTGDEIPLEGRITAVADVFDALMSNRVYRPALTLESTLRVLRAGRDTQFDSRVLDALLDSLPAVIAVRETYSDEPASASPLVAEGGG
jgi:putative two-component system response regulator